MDRSDIGEAAVEPSRCPHCGDHCESRCISLALPRSNSGLAVVRNVPADVCRACGDTQFTLDTTMRLMRLFSAETNPESVALVPIYNLEPHHAAKPS